MNNVNYNSQILTEQSDVLNNVKSSINKNNKKTIFQVSPLVKENSRQLANLDTLVTLDSEKNNNITKNKSTNTCNFNNKVLNKRKNIFSD